MAVTIAPERVRGKLLTAGGARDRISG
jgi:hypothetical protein